MLGAFAGLSLVTLITGSARALTACTAADIVAQDATNCPASGACTIKKDFDIPNGCTLDFAARDVTVANGAILDPGSGSVTFRARNFTIAAGGYIDARGNGAAPADLGGFVTIEATQAISVLKQSSLTGRIDASGNTAGGTIYLNAGTTVTIQGRLNVDALVALGSGGAIQIAAVGNISTASGSTITGMAGNGGSGGSLDVHSKGNIDLGDILTFDGADGGTVDITALGAVSVRAISVDGSLTQLATDTGSGGSIAVSAGAGVQLLGDLDASGRVDGCGGEVNVAASGGNITVTGAIAADSVLPFEGGGSGSVVLFTPGSVTIQSTAPISTHSEGRYGFSGGICIEGTNGITVGASLDASGGGCGGTVNVLSSGSIALNARVDASGKSYAGVGGAVTVCAGVGGQGSLNVNNTVAVTGGPCSVEDGCGSAGVAALEACDLNIAVSGLIDGRAPDGGGDLSLRAREQLTNNGSLQATATGDGFDGDIRFYHRIEKPPLGVGSEDPEAEDNALLTCLAADTPAGCQDPCPSCGNGLVEYPETCDMLGTPLNCDGCSKFCQLENCEDNNDCTIDSCDASLGCIHVLNPPCNTPTPTITRTNTSTRTPTITRTETPAAPTATRTASHTPTISATPTQSGTPTATPSITETPTITATPSETATSTVTATRTSTNTATHTPTVTPTASATSTPTMTSTATATRTPSETRTVTPTPATTATVTQSPTRTPISAYDTVIIAPRPVNERIALGAAAAAVTLKLKVRNADILPKAAKPGHVVRLTASDGTCPAGTVVGLPDFDKKTPGAQDTAIIAGGKAKKVVVQLSLASSAFTSFNLDSPARCTILLNADATSAGNVDPSPANNSVAVEVNVSDANDPNQTALHQTYVLSPSSTRFKIKRGDASASKTVTVKVGNADASDSFGHAATLTASDGDCPAGTITSVDFDSSAPGEQSQAAVSGGGTRAGDISVSVQAAAFHSPNKKSPARCTALIQASGPSGDADASNDQTNLVIDVTDQNDF